MLDQLKKLIGHSAVYGLGLVGSSIATLILTPMFLHSFNRAQYGMLEILNVFASMLYSFLLLGIASVLIKIYVNDCKSEQERRQLISSVVLFMGALAAAIWLLAFFFCKPLSGLLFKSRQHGLLVQLAAASSGLLLIQSMAVLCLRARQWPGRFIIATASQFTIVILLSFYFVWSRGLGVLGVQLAAIVAYGVSLSVGLFLIRTDLALQFSPSAISRVLVLSLPLIPASIVPWILRMSDRYFLNHFWGLADTGLYAVGYKIGMLGVSILINAFQLAWSPFFYASSDDEKAPRLCANVLKCYILVLVTGALMLSLFAPEILRVIGSREYWGAGWIVPYVALAYVFYGAQLYTIPLFIQTNNGSWLSLIMGGAAASNLILNCLLIPRFGVMGAITAMLVSFSLQMILSLYAANRFYPVPYAYKDFGKLLVSAVIIYLALRNVTTISLHAFMLKSASLLGYVLLLLVARFFSPRELAVIQSIPGKVMQRLSPPAGRAV